MENSKTAATILNDAADLLTEEGKWSKGALFRGIGSDNGCSMCAHGAIEYCGESKVRNAVLQGQLPSIAGWDGDYRSIITPTKTAHRLADQVGLTTTFNDWGTTTKEQVIDKLRQAAQLAENDQCLNG